MDLSEFIRNENEKPLDRMVSNGGLCACFRKIAVVGDSLSSGELEAMENSIRTYHDYYELSWGQFLARDCGSEVLNFSRGGMSAREYCTEFSKTNDIWNPDLRCQAYIIALGVNDISMILRGEIELGSIDDIFPQNYALNKSTFAGYYGSIISKYKEIQPRAKFFLVNIPKESCDDDRALLSEKHAELLEQISALFDNTYILDLRRFAPVYDEEFKKTFFTGGHMNVQGYRLTAKMIESYIDYIIRNNPEEFNQMGFIGKMFSYYEK